jgi:hypothetical protein
VGLGRGTHEEVNEGKNDEKTYGISCVFHFFLKTLLINVFYSFVQRGHHGDKQFMHLTVKSFAKRSNLIIFAVCTLTGRLQLAFQDAVFF